MQYGSFGKVMFYAIMISNHCFNFRDAISDTSDGYPDMAEALGVKLSLLEDKMPFEVG